MEEHLTMKTQMNKRSAPESNSNTSNKTDQASLAFYYVNAVLLILHYKCRYRFICN